MKNFICNTCSFSTTVKSALINHRKSCHGHIYTKCDICKRPHFEEDEHSCNHCLECNKVITYKKGINPDEQKFCSQSCAGTYNGKERKVSLKQKNKVKATMNKKTLIYIKEVFKKEKFKSFQDIKEYSRSFYRTLKKQEKINPSFYNQITKNFIKEEIISRNKRELDLSKRKKELEQIALKHTTRSSFSSFDKRAYDKARLIDIKHEKGFLDKICSHMKVVGSKYKRLIYAIEFPQDNKVYIGLTGNTNTRFSSHKKESSNKYVRELIKKGRPYKMIELTEYIDVNIASKEEGRILEDYKRKGFIILNINKTGGIGGSKRVRNTKVLRSNIIKHKNFNDLKNDKETYTLIKYYKITQYVKDYFNGINPKLKFKY